MRLPNMASVGFSKRMLRRVIVAGMALGLVLGHSCSDITSTTLLCEDAAARIYACCDRHAAINCNESGCGSQHPNFTPETAKCLRTASCAALQKAGLCEVPDWQFSIGTICHDGQASCPADFGTCPPTLVAACAALGRLSCP